MLSEEESTFSYLFTMGKTAIFGQNYYFWEKSQIQLITTPN